MISALKAITALIKTLIVAFVIYQIVIFDFSRLPNFPHFPHLILDVQVFKLTPDIDEYNKKSNKQISVNCYVFQHYVDE